MHFNSHLFRRMSGNKGDRDALKKLGWQEKDQGEISEFSRGSASEKGARPWQADELSEFPGIAKGDIFSNFSKRSLLQIRPLLKPSSITIPLGFIASKLPIFSCPNLKKRLTCYLWGGRPESCCKRAYVRNGEKGHLAVESSLFEELFWIVGSLGLHRPGRARPHARPLCTEDELPLSYRYASWTTSQVDLL